MLPPSLRSTGPPTRKPVLRHDRRSDQLQHDAKYKRNMIVPAPAANESEQRGTKRADSPTDRIRQPHDDGKASGTELAIDNQRRQGNEIANGKAEQCTRRPYGRHTIRPQDD